MSVAKKIIITVGMYGVGKSRYADLWVEKHPEYVIVPCGGEWDALTDEICSHEYVIMDYYFRDDYNANRLREKAGCPVEIIVLFDAPENIVYRQIYLKPPTLACNVDCFHVRHLGESELRELIDVRAARYMDGDYNEYDYDGFRATRHEYWKPYSREAVAAYLDKIEQIKEYDKHYHHINLPHGFRIGRDGYARNEQTWDIIKGWFDWRGLRVLDLCCFHGYFCQQIWFAGGVPVGVDVHQHALYSAAIFAKMLGADYKLYQHDVEQGFPENKDGFDLVLLFNVFHHIKDKPSILRHIRIYPAAMFEINKTNREQIEEYFDVVREAESPKDGRVILLCKPKITDKEQE